MLRPSPNHGTQRLPDDDDDDRRTYIMGKRGERKKKEHCKERQNKSCTFLKQFPSLTSGTDGNDRSVFMSMIPPFRLVRLLIMIRRSDVVLTGRNRFLGTLIPSKTP